jgi:hypothetical protein
MSQSNAHPIRDFMGGILLTIEMALVKRCDFIYGVLNMNVADETQMLVRSNIEASSRLPSFRINRCSSKPRSCNVSTADRLVRPF